MEAEVKSCCMACLRTDGENMKVLNETWNSELTYLHLLDFLLGTEDSTQYSTHLCKLCETKLIQAYLFKKQCLESKRILLQKGIKEEVVSEECSISQPLTEKDNALNHGDLESKKILFKKGIKEEVITEESPLLQILTVKGTALNHADSDVFHVDSMPTEDKTTEEPILQDTDDDQEIPIDDHSTSIEEDSEVPPAEETTVSKYNCLKCAIKFASYQEYQSHYRESHRQKHVCSECGKLVARHNLEKHQLCHSRPEHVCESCGRAFTLRENLTKHIRIHKQDHRYECEYCGKMFIHWNSKRCHVISQHTREKKYECTFCNKKFAHSSNMLRHMRYHTGEMTHTCSYCAKVFNTTSELKNHIITHTKEKNEVCEICKKAFGTRKGLKNHLKTHTGERDYVCPVCDKAFTQPHVLRTHLKSHPDYPMPPPGAILSRKRLEREYKLECSAEV